MTSRRAAAAVVVSHPAVSRRARRGGESATARRASTASRASRVGVERIAALTSLSAETLGRLDAESREGLGSRFTISLPVAEASRLLARQRRNSDLTSQGRAA